MLLEPGDPVVRSQILMLVVTEVIDPQLLAGCEPGLQSRQEVVELVLPCMADKYGGLPDLLITSSESGCGSLLFEQLAVREAATVAQSGFGKTLHHWEDVSSGTVLAGV